MQIIDNKHIEKCIYVRVGKHKPMKMTEFSSILPQKLHFSSIFHAFQTQSFSTPKAFVFLKFLPVRRWMLDQDDRASSSRLFRRGRGDSQPGAPQHLPDRYCLIRRRQNGGWLGDSRQSRGSLSSFQCCSSRNRPKDRCTGSVLERHLPQSQLYAFRSGGCQPHVF